MAKAERTIFSAEGAVEGIEYVTVLDSGGNPLEYEIPRADAIARYGEPAGWYDDPATRFDGEE